MWCCRDWQDAYLMSTGLHVSFDIACGRLPLESADWGLIYEISAAEEQ